MNRRSRSPRSERAAVALAAAVAGCSSVVGSEHESFDFVIGEPDGAALVATWEGALEDDEFSVGVAASFTHSGAEPCAIAVYLHATQPDRKDMPVLTGLPAPETAGELIFDGVLLPPRDGVVFRTTIGSWELGPGLLGGLHAPDEFHQFPAEPPTTRRWLTIATCAAPDIHATIELTLGFSRPDRPGRTEAPGDISAAVFWR